MFVQLKQHRQEARPSTVLSEAQRSPGRSIDPDVRAPMERALGADFSGVRVHEGPHAAALDAHAFTFGDDIHFAPGGYRPDSSAGRAVLGHELTHVVQQRQGRAQATAQLKGVAVDDRSALEAEADAMGARIARGEAGGGPALAARRPAPARTGAGGPVQRRPVVQRLVLGQRPFAKGYASLTSDPTWLTKAEAYEKRLGLYAYSHTRSKEALDAALTKMEQVIRTHYKSAARKSKKRKNLYRDVFTKDDAGSAGQIGTEASYAQIKDMLTNGNLRERMTAFYNAAYYNSPGSTPLRGFKEIVADILFNDNEKQAADQANALELDPDDLQAKSHFLRKDWTRWGLKMATALTSKGYNFADDPFALGNLTLAKEARGTGEMGASQYERIPRPAAEKDAEKRTAQDYENLGIPLSAREKAYTAKKLGKNPTDADYPTTKLPWQEGHTYYKMVPTRVPGMSWMASIRDTLRMPVVAGVSGTTTRMLTAFKWLKTGIDPLDFRLALMGWMLPAWDHSLYEILRGSHLAGVKGRDEGNLTDVIDMYMNIPPLDTDDLRAHVAVNKQFPHEEVYMERIKAPADPTGFKAVFDANKAKATAKYNAAELASPNPSFSAAHATAIHGYTTGIHLLMNTVMSAPTEMLGKKLVRDKLKANARHQCCVAYLEHKATTGTLTPAEATELAALKAEPVEPIDILKKEGKIDTWIAHCQTVGTTVEVEKYLKETVNPWIDSIMGSLYEELKVHVNMNVEALRALPAVTGATVWRGDWSSMIGSRYEQGKVITHDTLTSYSRNQDIAKNFASSGSMSYKVLIELKLSGEGGRDIEKLSAFPGEKEVLMMPGSRIRIDSVTWETHGGQPLKVCTAEELPASP